MALPPPPDVDSAGWKDWIFRFYKQGAGSTEDTWTPGIAFGGGSTGLTYTTHVGSYIKIGNWVWVTCIIVMSAKGSSTGNATLTGLPYAIANNDNARAAFTISGSSFTYTGQFQLQAIKNTTTAAFTQTIEAGTFSALADTNFTNGTTLIISGFYKAA